MGVAAKAGAAKLSSKKRLTTIEAVKLVGITTRDIVSSSQLTANFFPSP
jgi:hypothetical protein